MGFGYRFREFCVVHHPTLEVGAMEHPSGQGNGVIYVNCILMPVF